MIKRVLIANRGEIALRIIRSCRELGIETVVAYSSADRDSLPVRLADHAVCVGPSEAKASYLNIPALIAVACHYECDAVHPGYGFLSENAEFAEACQAQGLTFIGPSAEAIRLMGNKSRARESARKAGIPVIEGSPILAETADVKKWAERVGFPLLFKAAAGGGGRGMRQVQSMSELLPAWELAKAESSAAFGDDSLYMERYVDNARHIEIQVMGDRQGNVVHLAERDCSLQRRHQKIIEEAPSPVLSEPIRQQMGEASCAFIQQIGYENVGTIEYLFDTTTERFFFMEMNTRIQVEHPVTEMITGTDLVREQLLIAGHALLRVSQSDIQVQGHSIEARITAEDASRNFAPAPGRITRYHAPGGPGVRVDSHCYEGYEVPAFYDSLLSKLVVWDQTRMGAINRLERALGEYEIEGIATLLPFHQFLVQERAFLEGRVDTRFVEREVLPKFKARMEVSRANDET